MSVRALGYLGLNATDLDAWRSFGTKILGLMDVSNGDRETLAFRMDSRARRLTIHNSRNNDIAYMGFETADKEAFETVLRRVSASGTEITPGTSDFAEERGVVEVAYFKDPLGIQIEVFYGATELFEQPFSSPAGVTGFVTGEQGLGHVVLATADPGRAERFYIEGLGLRLTDIIDAKSPMGSVHLRFMNCNPRHHTLALAGIPAPMKLNHFMIQVASIDDMGLAYDRALAAGTPIFMSLGRHTNDHMTSFYAITPSGAVVEYGWGARQIDDGWKVVRYDKASIWGHKFMTPPPGAPGGPPGLGKPGV